MKTNTNHQTNRFQVASFKFQVSSFEFQPTTDNEQPTPPCEFHVSRKARQKYDFDLSMFSTNGSVIFANFHAARLFAQKINDKRDLLNHPDQAASAAEINAMGLIDEILHTMVEQYRQQQNSQVFKDALDWLEAKFSSTEIDKALQLFVDDFPPIDVYLNKISVADYLKGETGKRSNRRIALEEMLMLWISNENPAFKKYAELFDDSQLREKTVYPKMMPELNEFFDEQPLFGPQGQGKNLLQQLLEPAKAAPGSLSDQLQFIRENWTAHLSPNLSIKWEMQLGKSPVQEGDESAPQFETRLLRTIDFITEEQKMRFNPGLGPAPTHVPEYTYAEAEPEQFSPDLHWMPRLVLIAKSTLVWLDQLSKQYRQSITRLDQIPDEELDKLARWGFTGLWLIGIWERSPASKQIKQMCGNPEAESSAYSLHDYQIAEELGGDDACQNLRERCWKRGIRLASDMVPNHTGITSRWVVEHPEWYIQLPYPPFPSYSFNGVNLAHSSDTGIFLEDHYYDRTDAAVVFKHVDLHSGKSRFIYHGNDGTSMPWNDTAQLDYTNPEVREAVIQTILEVARKFPVIRFDAAMTLAKRHFHRLWFPEPGSGGDIPSRSEHGLARPQFDALIPQEFWREVVDRVAKEVPDTLLLAEAFWMMEGYFVRSLGMHRVYNSAFMHMMMKEENKKYRYTIKNTIEFEPEVLKRYVNFMNNPDEDTAIDQFGDGDKYFGVCMMMATMPGLPMFGHGQIEGYHEKYGMEYRRAYYDEQPNQYLIERHEREIFPILKKRYLFAEVENFLLYDLYTEHGTVNENVFAYSNRFEGERSLVVFHNAYAETRGWIRTSAAFTEKLNIENAGQERRLVQKALGDGLDLPQGESFYCIFRDYISGLEYIQRCQALWERGMYIELGAYKYQVFLDFRIVEDSDTQQYARLAESLKGQGVPGINEALQELHLQPIHQPFAKLFNAKMLDKLIASREPGVKAKEKTALLKEAENAYADFITAASEFSGKKTSAKKLAKECRRDVAAALKFDVKTIEKKFAPANSRKFKAAIKLLANQNGSESLSPAIFISLAMLQKIGKLFDDKEFVPHSRSLLDEWLLTKRIRRTFSKMGFDAKRLRLVQIRKQFSLHDITRLI